MSPSELFALVRELPREVWPDWCEWFNGQWVVGDYQDRQRNRTAISPEHAAALFVARLVEELLKANAKLCMRRWTTEPPDDFIAYLESDRPDSPRGTNPPADRMGTPLAAIVAAYKAATPPG